MPASPPSIASIRIVGGEGKAATAASKAARHIFPDATVARSSELSDVLQRDFPAGTELLVLLAPGQAEVDRAVGALDARSRPRWAVVARSQAIPGLDSHLVSIQPEDWTEPVLAQAFVSAVRLQGLKSANAQLRGDLRTISRRLGHDMRSPLNCILTASEAMKDPEENPESPQAVFGQSIADSVDEVVGLLDRISFILKATTNPPPSQQVIMEEIVWGALQRVESQLLNVGATVSKPKEWPVVEGVPAWIDVIWSNLLTNSVKFAGPKPRIELGWEELPDGHRFWLCDHGKGVMAGHESHLFYPLDRLSELNAPRGFGLSIVHRLVELQGGRCGHERALGGSGTFYFTLPAGGTS